MRYHRFSLFLLFVGILMGLLSCTGPSALPTLLPSPTPDSKQWQPLQLPTLRPSPTQPPTATPRPSATPTATATPTVVWLTPTPSPTFTPTPTIDAYRFGGRCQPGMRLPCLYHVGKMIYKQEYVYRYVFENILYPRHFFMELNGAELECVYLPEFSKTRVYCMGPSPYRLFPELRIGYRFGGDERLIFIPPAIQGEMRLWLPQGTPPGPIPWPSPTATATGTQTPTPLPSFTPTNTPPITPTATSTP